MSAALPSNRPAIRAAQILFIVGVVLMMLAPSVAMLFGRTSKDTLGEKRTLRSWPAWPRSREAIRTFPHDVEAYIKDRFALRQPLIRLHSRIVFFVLHASPAPAVVRGRDGWLFYNSRASGDADDIADCTGSMPLTDTELRRVTTELQRRNDWLEQRSIPFVVIIPPNKSSMYHEHLPPGFEHRGLSPLDQLIAAAPAQCPGVTILDIRPPLAEAKRQGDIYLHTDTHWNDTGALVGTRELVRTIRAAGINVHVPETTDYTRTILTNKPGGDIAVMLGIRDLVLEPEIPKFKPATPELESVEITSAFQKRTGATVFTQSRTNLPALLMWHDSFGLGMLPFLNPCFSRSAYAPGNSLDEKLVTSFQPDVVVLELVERNLRPMSRFAFSENHRPRKLPDNVP